MTGADQRFVTTPDIRAAVKGRETELLDTLKVDWRRGKLHIPCPYQDHDDNNPSWRWDERKCKAFCTCGARDVLGVLMGVEGIEFDAAKVRAAELLNRPELVRERRARKRKGESPSGLHLAGYAQAKRLPIEFLRSLGLTEITYLGAPAIRIPYYGVSGGESAVRFRTTLEKAPNRFRWRSGAKVCLYGLNRLIDARKAGFAVLVEGESDCHTLWLHGFSAIGLPGNTNWNELRDAPLLSEIPTIYVVIEPDKGGETVMKWLRNSSIAPRAKLVRMKSAKDASALYLADPDGFAAAFQRELDDAEPFCAIRKREASAEFAQAAAVAGDLIREPDLLSRFA